MKSIVRSMDLTAIPHRADFTSCPCEGCDARFDFEVWDKHAVMLVLDPVRGKHGSVVLVSECPTCFGRSWVHCSFDAFLWDETQPKAWRSAVAKERGVRHLSAVHTFADSLCARCQCLRTLECDTLPIVHCTMGKTKFAKDANGVDIMDYSFSCADQCGKFVPRRPRSFYITDSDE